MAAVMDRLRALDRAAGFGSSPTREQWLRWVRLWPVFLASALLLVLVFAWPDFLGGFFAVYFAFLAGAMKAEHDRVRGRTTFFGQHRPPGV